LKYSSHLNTEISIHFDGSTEWKELNRQMGGISGRIGFDDGKLALQAQGASQGRKN